MTTKVKYACKSMLKQVGPGVGSFLPQGYNLYNPGRHQLDEAM